MGKRRQARQTGPLRVLGYVRVSTEEQADSGAGLDAQRAAVVAEAERRGWELVDVVEDAGISGKRLDRRPALVEALRSLSAGEADVLLVAKLDRLTRSLVDAAGLIAQSIREGWRLVALDLGLDLTTPQGEMVAHVMASFAQFERRLIGQRTREALAARRAAGVRLGRPRTLSSVVVARLVSERAAGSTLAVIASRLNADAVPTAQGGAAWYPSTVAAVLRSAQLDQAA